MGPMLSTAVDALFAVLSWPNILYPIGGTLIAMLASILPGVSGVALMAIAIPLTFFWEPLEIALLFGALVGGATFMGSITAILMNVPGRNSNAATAIDGYPMSQQGKAKTAIASAATASALGSSFGVLILLMLLPVLYPVALAFGPFDMVMAIICGLTTIAFVVRGSWIKGLTMAGFGMVLSFIGTDQQTAAYRFTYELPYLRDGLSPVLVFLGIFAVAEMMELAVKKTQTISGRTRSADLSGSVHEGIVSVFKYFGLFLRSSTIGTLIGMMPGVGSVVASFIAYGHATQSADEKSTFGKGDIRGVIAPEAANDAKDGGALVPTLAVGLPGGLGTAMLLTALSVHGLSPGPAMLTQHLDLIFVLIWSLFLSNWLTSILGLAGVSGFAKITTLPNRFLIPGVLALVALAAYTYRGYTPDVLLVFAAGVFGYYLKKYNWPRIPFVIAMVLGPYFENQFHVSRQLFKLDRVGLSDSPIAIIFLVLTLVALFLVFLRRHAQVGKADSEQDSMLFSGMLGLFFISILWQTAQLNVMERMVPLVVVCIALLLLGIHLFRTIAGTRDQSARAADGTAAFRNLEQKAIMGIFVLGPLSFLLGPQIAISLFLYLYLVLRSGLKPGKALVISAITFGLCSTFVRYALQRSFDAGFLMQIPGIS